MLEKAANEFPDFRLRSDPEVLKRWRALFEQRRHINVPAKATIVEQGQRAGYVYYIMSGLVEYTYLDQYGEQNLIEILGDDCLFPLQPLFGENGTVGSFLALEDCVLSVMDVGELYRQLDDKALAIELLQEFSKIIGGHVRQIGMNLDSTSQRVEQILCLLAEYRQKRTRPGEFPMITMSQGDLARITRTTRVTVTKIISDLRHRGIVETTYGGIIIADLERLKKEAALAK